MESTKSDSQFQAGLLAYRKGNYQEASESFFSLLDQGQVWFELLAFTASSLFRQGELEKSQRIFQDVLRLHEQNPDEELEESLIYYWLATAFVVLDDMEQATQFLSLALEHNPRVWYKIPEQAEWHKASEDPRFAAMLKEEKKLLDTLFYRGKPMHLEELDEADLGIIQGFVSLLRSHGWHVDDALVEDLEEGKAVSPQGYAVYSENAGLILHLHLHLDENLLYFELEDPLTDESQAFRLHPKKGFKRLLETIVDFQEAINPENRLQYIKSLISQCKDLYYELPNGTKMRMKKM